MRRTAERICHSTEKSRTQLTRQFLLDHVFTLDSMFFYLIQEQTRADTHNRRFFRKNNYTGVAMHQIKDLPWICRTPKATKEVELARVQETFETNDENDEKDIDMCFNSFGPAKNNTNTVGLVAVPNADALMKKGLITLDVEYRDPDRFKHRSQSYTFELNRASQALREIRRGYEALQQRDQDAEDLDLHETVSETF